MSDILKREGYATMWHRPGCPLPLIHGAIAGIWDGGQLNDREEDDLAAFCSQMGQNRASVLALLDFPRRDRVGRALQMGAAAVLGKPWLNVDLIGTLANVSELPQHARAA